MKKHVLGISLFLMILLLPLSVLHAQSKHFAGEWKTDGSSVRFVISIESGQIQMQAIDDSDGEVLKVTNVKLEGKKTIHYTLHTPSTNFTVHPTMNLKGKREIQEVLNNENETKLTYRKVE